MRRAPVSPRLYSARLLETFAGGAHARFLAGGGRDLRPRVGRAIELARFAPGQTVVDLGCGRGEAAAYAAGRGARVIALDYSLEALAMTRATAAVVAAGSGPGPAGAASPARPLVAACDATSLPLADGCADRVLWLDVVEHLWPWQVDAALAEVRRILRPDGFVVIHTLPNRWALAVGYPLLRCVSPGLPANPRSAYERAVHVNEQSPRSLARSLAAAGFRGRVWVEEWSTVQAGRQTDDDRYPDRHRTDGYPTLRRPVVRRLAGLAMRTPLRWCVGNDIFAVASPARGSASPAARETIGGDRRRRRAGPR